MAEYRIETIYPTITNLGVTYVGHCRCGHKTGIHGDRALAVAQIRRCIHPLREDNHNA